MIIVILIVSLLIRLISLNQSLWLDEAINILAAKNYSLIGIITEYAKGDFHPPGFFIMLWIWGRLFDFSEISMRFPSLIFGVLSVFLVYLIGKNLFSKKIALFSAAIMAVNPLHVYYSQEARMYSFATFAVCLNVFLFIKLLNKNPIPRLASYLNLSFILSNILVLMSDYVAYLIFPSQFIFILITKHIRFLKRWLIFFATSLLVSGSWIFIFINQLNEGLKAASDLPVWNNIVGSVGLKPLLLTYIKFIIGRISHPDFPIYTLLFLPIGLLFSFLILKSIKHLNDLERKILLTWLVLPIVLASLISFFVPIFSYFRVLFVLPSFILLTAFGVFSLKSKIKYILAMVVILIQLMCSSIYLFNPIFHREDWRGLVDFLRTKNASTILFESNGTFAPFNYYSKDQLMGTGALRNFPANTADDLIDLDARLEKVNNVYLIEYLVEISDPKRLVQNEILRLNYREIETRDFRGVGFIRIYAKE